MNNKKKLVGNKIKEIRKQNKITQEVFSEIIGIEPSSLSNIENGKSFPSMGTILKIMDEFNISPENFFDFEYFKEEESLEEEIIEKIKKLPYQNKQLIFKIIKQF